MRGLLVQHTQGQLWSKTESVLQGICTRGKAWEIVADKSCIDYKTLQDYMRHAE